MKQNLGLLQIRTVVQMGLLLAGLGEAQTLQWVKPALASLPSDRCCGAMVFDPLMRASLLFGGGNGGIEPAVRYNDTWTFPVPAGGRSSPQPPLHRRVKELELPTIQPPKRSFSSAAALERILM